MNKHLYNSGVEKSFLSMAGNLGDLIMLNNNNNNQYDKNNLN